MLSATEHLNQQGYVILRGVVDPAAVNSARAKVISEWETFKKDGRLWFGGGTILGHVNYAPAPDLNVFFDAITCQQVLACVVEELGAEIFVYGIGGNLNMPRSHHQPVHVDATDNNYLIVNLPLGDVDETNGSLELWPGSHRSKLSYSQVTLQKKLPSTRVNTRAGDVVLRYPHVWHRGTPNNSSVARVMVAASIGRKRASDDYGSIKVSPRNQEQLVIGKLAANFDVSPEISGKFLPNYFSTRPIGILRELMCSYMPTAYHALKLMGR